MKFLCDNCKAKYQIADEKVAGKTVRMKCRKCGHQIEVRAAVTETSVASQPPRPMAGGASGGSGLGGLSPRTPAAPSRLATSLSNAKPPARVPSQVSQAPSSALAGAFNRNVQDAPASVPAGATGASAGGQSQSIELSVTDEWYVAINGVPVGPVRISELRRKAAAGAVTEESLCWQEGLEEWRPIRSIPDLAELVREAASGNRPSLIGPPPPEQPATTARSPSMPSAPRIGSAPATSRISTVPGAPRPMTPSAPSFGSFGGSSGRSNVVPLRPAATSSPLDDLMGSGGSRPDIGSRPGVGGGSGGAAAAFAPSPFGAPQSHSAPLSQPMMPIAPAVDPFALPPLATPSSLGPPPNFRDSGIGMAPLAPPTPMGQHSPSVMPPQPMMYDQGKRGVPLWFWPILVLALGFGGGVAFLVFRPQQTPAPVVIQMPATTTAQPTANNDIPPPTTDTPAQAASETKPGTKIATKTTPKTQPTEEKKGLDLSGLGGPNGGGPNVGPGGPGAAAGGGLDQAGVERVVANHRAGVKRTCWERGGADQKSSVNVTISANVAPNGSVASTSSTGDDPVVAKCIESQVKSWQFPAPGTNTTINIPFKFVRQ